MTGTRCNRTRACGGATNAAMRTFLTLCTLVALSANAHDALAALVVLLRGVFLMQRGLRASRQLGLLLLLVGSPQARLGRPTRKYFRMLSPSVAASGPWQASVSVAVGSTGLCGRETEERK